MCSSSLHLPGLGLKQLRLGKTLLSSGNLQCKQTLREASAARKQWKNFPNKTKIILPIKELLGTQSTFSCIRFYLVVLFQMEIHIFPFSSLVPVRCVHMFLVLPAASVVNWPPLSLDTKGMKRWKAFCLRLQGASWWGYHKISLRWPQFHISGPHQDEKLSWMILQQKDKWLVQGMFHVERIFLEGKS